MNSLVAGKLLAPIVRDSSISNVFILRVVYWNGEKQWEADTSRS